MAGAVVILGIGFVISSIMAIILYTQRNAEAQRADNAQRDQTRLISSADRQNTEIPNRYDGTSADNTLVGQLYDEILYYRQLIGGPATEQTQNLEQKKEAVSAELEAIDVSPDTPLLGSLQDSSARIAELSRTVENLETQLNTQLQRVSQLEQAKEDVQKQYTAAESDLGERLSSVSGGFERQIQRFDDLRNDLENQLRDLQAEKEAESTELTDQVLEARQQVRSLQTRLDELMDRVGGNAGGVDPSLVADGRLISDPDSEGLVSISLGRKDHLILGTTFQVFDNRTGVVKNAQGQLEGKAKIEVVNVFEETALARIVERKSNVVITRDDVIANVVYDPQMTVEFFVFGDHARPGDSRPSIGGRRWVESLVSKWDGRLADELSINTDFVILGAQPIVPPQPDEINIEEWDRWNKLREKADDYQQILNRARELKIPILNQNEFLTMIGYYQR